jgi:hypothetical protein
VIGAKTSTGENSVYLQSEEVLLALACLLCPPPPELVVSLLSAH